MPGLHEHKDTTLHAKVTPTEAARVRARAKRWGWTVSRFLREGTLLLLKRRRKPKGESEG